MSVYPIGAEIGVNALFNDLTTQQPAATSAMVIQINKTGVGLQAYSTTLNSVATGWKDGKISALALSGGTGHYTLRVLGTRSGITYQGQIKPESFELVSSPYLSGGEFRTAYDLINYEIDLISQARSDIAAIWSQASGITITYDTLFSRIYQYLLDKQTAVDATGAFTLRNIGDSADLATWSLTDDDTTTVKTEVVWI